MKSNFIKYYLTHVRYDEGKERYKLEYSCGIKTILEYRNLGSNIETIIET